jgi:hypothetical protein
MKRATHLLIVGISVICALAVGWFFFHAWALQCVRALGL